MSDLFASAPAVPLAEALRPASIDEVIGQRHLLGPGKPLRLARIETTYARRADEAAAPALSVDELEALGPALATPGAELEYGFAASYLELNRRHEQGVTGSSRAICARR